jgi:RNA polymerase sigma-70 factor, ECF subfamily
MKPPPRDKAELFVMLLARHERQIAAYVMTLVPQAADADDVLQEAKVVMWRHFDEFTPGTSFTAWARKVAFHQVLTHRKRRKRDRLEFSDQFLTAVAEESERSADRLDERQRRLADCLDKLLPEHKQILELRYGEGLAIEPLSLRVHRTVAAVYRVLSRIRAHLHACVGANQGEAFSSHGIDAEPS